MNKKNLIENSGVKAQKNSDGFRPFGVRNEDAYVNDFILLDHKERTVTLNLSHMFNPNCLGCKETVAESKQIAKDLGYAFKIKEPLSDQPFNTVNGIRIESGKVTFI